MMRSIQKIAFALFSALLLASCATSAGVGADSAGGAVAESLKAIVERTYAPDQPGAVVLVEKDGEVLLRMARGLADVELSVPLEPDHLFKIGSISKQFTAVAVLELANRGRLSLSDPVGKFLDGFPPPADAITIEQLLTHTSGIVEYTGIPEYDSQLRQDAKPEEIIALVRARPLLFEPGTSLRYTNSAYFILAQIVEEVAGKPFPLFLEEEILEPHGFQSIVHDDLKRIIPGRVTGYGRDGEVRRNATVYSPTRAVGVGGLLASADALRRWNQLLLAGEILPPSLLERAWTSARLTNGSETGYGYGWFIDEIIGKRAIQHGGDIPGFSAHVLSVPSEKLWVAVLSNDESHQPRAEFVAFQLAREVLGEPYPPAPVRLTASDIERVTGTWTDAKGVTREISFRDGRLAMKRGEGKPTIFLPVGEGRFVAAESFLGLELVEPEGTPTLILSWKGKELARATRAARATAP